MQETELHAETKYLSEAGFGGTDDVKICRHNLREIRDTFRAETLEDESDRLDDRSMVLR